MGFCYCVGMTTKEAHDKLNELVNDIVELIREDVQRIERKTATTRSHYGDYMAIITSFADGNPIKAKVIALACIKAGGNRQGVFDALKVSFGI